MLTIRERTHKREMSREQLSEVKLIRPELAGKTWRGIQHGELVETLHQSLEKRGVKTNDEHWFVEGMNNSHLTGSMSLRIKGFTAPEGMDFSIGINHSNNLDFALRFAVGTKIFVCSNGMVVGDYTLQRRHTNGVDLIGEIEQGVEQYLQRVPIVAETVQTMQAREISPVHRDQILMQAGREGLLPWSRIGAVDAQVRKPRFAVFKGDSAWSLYNAFTYTVQKSPAHEQISSMSRFRELVLAQAS